MDYQKRIQAAKTDLISVLMKHDVLYGRASEYANKYVQGFVETGTWTKESLEDLKNIGIDFGESNRHGSSNDHQFYRDIADVFSKYVLTFAERARLELECDKSNLTPEEAEQRKQDILALVEIENLCNGKKECSVTNEQKEWIQVLTEGLDPEKFLNPFEKTIAKSPVTNEEIESFRTLGQKFGLSDELINEYISKTTFGTPTGYVQNIINNQLVKKRAKSLSALMDRKVKDCRGSFLNRF